MSSVRVEVDFGWDFHMPVDWLREIKYFAERFGWSPQWMEKIDGWVAGTGKSRYDDFNSEDRELFRKKLTEILDVNELVEAVVCSNQGKMAIEMLWHAQDFNLTPENVDDLVGLICGKDSNKWMRFIYEILYWTPKDHLTQEHLIKFCENAYNASDAFDILRSVVGLREKDITRLVRKVCNHSEDDPACWQWAFELLKEKDSAPNWGNENVQHNLSEKHRQMLRDYLAEYIYIRTRVAHRIDTYLETGEDPFYANRINREKEKDPRNLQ